MKRIVAVVILAVACASTAPNSPADRADAVRAALNDLGGGERIETLVVATDSSAELRRELSKSMRVIRANEIPESSTETLPASYARLTDLEITGNHGTMHLIVGPVPKAKQNEMVLACGTMYTFALDRGDSGWRATVTSVAVC